MTRCNIMIILCPHAAVVESAYTADLKSAPKGYGFKSRQRHHVERTPLGHQPPQAASGRPMVFFLLSKSRLFGSLDFAVPFRSRSPIPPFKSEAAWQLRFCFLIVVESSAQNLPPRGKGDRACAVDEGRSPCAIKQTSHGRFTKHPRRIIF